jgi:hypothetical protein
VYIVQRVRMTSVGIAWKCCVTPLLRLLHKQMTATHFIKKCPVVKQDFILCSLISHLCLDLPNCLFFCGFPRIILYCCLRFPLFVMRPVRLKPTSITVALRPQNVHNPLLRWGTTPSQQRTDCVAPELGTSLAKLGILRIWTTINMVRGL